MKKFWSWIYDIFAWCRENENDSTRLLTKEECEAVRTSFHAQNDRLARLISSTPMISGVAGAGTVVGTKLDIPEVEPIRRAYAVARLRHFLQTTPKDATRGDYLAYAYLRNVPYRQVENRSHSAQDPGLYRAANELAKGLERCGYWDRSYNSGESYYKNRGILKETWFYVDPSFPFPASSDSVFTAAHINYWSKYDHATLRWFLRTNGWDKYEPKSELYELAVAKAMKLRDCRSTLRNLGLVSRGVCC